MGNRILIPPFDLEQMEEKIELLIQRCFAQKVCTAGGKEQTKICTRQNRGTVGTIVRRNYIKRDLHICLTFALSLLILHEIRNTIDCKREMKWNTKRKVMMVHQVDMERFAFYFYVEIGTGASCREKKNYIFGS